MGELKDELAKALALEQPVVCYIQHVYNRFKQELSGRTFKTPLPEEVLLCAENFPYLVHLHVKDPISAQYREAKANRVIPLLEKGDFDDADYILKDPRRAQVLCSLPSLLVNPDHIFENSRHTGKGNCVELRGEHIYVQEFKHNKKQVKVALTLFDPRLGKSVIVSSFFSNWNWLKRCGQTCKYTKKK